MEVREGEEQPAALAAAEAPVALSVGVVGQRVAGGGEASSRSRQSPTTAWRTAERRVSMRNKWTFVISSGSEQLEIRRKAAGSSFTSVLMSPH